MLFRGDLACNIALDAVRTVARDHGGKVEIDIKNYAKVEKVGILDFLVPFQRDVCAVELFYFARKETNQLDKLQSGS